MEVGGTSLPPAPEALPTRRHVGAQKDEAKWCKLLRDMGASRSPRVQLEGLGKRASVRRIGDWIVLEYVLSEASLASLRWGKNGADYSEIWVRQGPRGSNLRALAKELV